MSSKSDYLENKVLDHFLGTASTSTTSQAYLGLFTATPTEAGVQGNGYGGTEVSGNGYQRQAINFSSASSASTTNNADITFTANSSGGFGTITHFAVFDAQTNGNMLYFGALSDDKTIEASDSLKFSSGTGITITEG